MCGIFSRDYQAPKGTEYSDYLRHINAIPCSTVLELDALGFHADAASFRDSTEARTFLREYVGITNGNNGNLMMTVDTTSEGGLAVKIQRIVEGLPAKLSVDDVTKRDDVFFHAEPINGVLIREVEHNNRMLNVIRQSLEGLLSNDGVEWSSRRGFETIASDITRDVIPRLWIKALAFPTRVSLTKFLQAIKRQVEYIREWSNANSMRVKYEFAYLTFHKSLIVACQLSYARRRGVDFHDVELKTEIITRDAIVENCCNFIVVSGLYITAGAEWTNNGLTMSKNCTSSFHKMPDVACELVDRTRVVERERANSCYKCPLYVTALKEQQFFHDKADNLIGFVELDTDGDPKVLSVCGTALFCKIE